MVLVFLLAGLALLSLFLTLWQWLAAVRFPLHERVISSSALPSVTLLKPLKGCDASTRACLESWLTQSYAAPVQILFAVASGEDPVCTVVRELLDKFPEADAQLTVCGPLTGTNLKVAKLDQIQPKAKHKLFIISDADVSAPPDFLVNAVAPLQDPKVGLVSCFYRLANPVTLPMRWEAVAINADFWSQVLQAKTLRPLDFALGAVMVVRRAQLEEIGGFKDLRDFLADDYELGHRIAGRGYHIALCPVVVECRSGPTGWAETWKHQLRWARTIRGCQPAPYFFSILSNGTFWPLLCVAARPTLPFVCLAAMCWLARVITALNLQRRIEQRRVPLKYAWLIPVKDLLQVLIWLGAFLGNRVEWRGRRLRLRSDGTLVGDEANASSPPPRGGSSQIPPSPVP